MDGVAAFPPFAQAEEMQHKVSSKPAPEPVCQLEVQYRFQLQADWQAQTLAQLTALEQELARERASAEALTRQVKDAQSVASLAYEDSAQNQLLVRRFVPMYNF